MTQRKRLRVIDGGQSWRSSSAVPKEADEDPPTNTYMIPEGTKLLRVHDLRWVYLTETYLIDVENADAAEVWNWVEDEIPDPEET